MQSSMYEVVTTEQYYLERLGVAVDHFMKSSTLNLALSPRDHKSLFSNVMREELESNLLCDMLCDVVHRHTSCHFGAYVDYIRNMPYQEQTMHNLGVGETNNPQIMEMLRKLQDDQRCYRLPLKSYLVLPFQRITRLKILIEVRGVEILPNLLTAWYSAHSIVPLISLTSMKISCCATFL
uniref:DH domain-containing protein n=1 Tax=Hucho hucho TaxID=62062 RepID=A0A4W5RVI1_9TELE